MDNLSAVTRFLGERNIPFRIFRHPGPITSLEQAARERGQTSSQVIRSLLFRLPGNEFVMVLMSGPEQVSWKKLRRFLNQKRLTLANDDEVLSVTGSKRGAVSPFGLPTSIQILVDQAILELDEVSIGSGERGTTIILRMPDLLKALGNIEIGDFQEDLT